jgi:hypothetical protein
MTILGLPEPVLRFAAFAGVFAVMLLLERAFPRRTLTQARVGRWPTNLVMVGLGGLCVRLMGAIAMPLVAVGAAIMAAMPALAHRHTTTRLSARRLLTDAVRGLTTRMRLPIIRTLLMIAFIVEMFAFAYTAVLPSLARDVLHVGVDGLGTLNMMASFGALIGVAALTTWSSSVRNRIGDRGLWIKGRGDFSASPSILDGTTIARSILPPVKVTTTVEPHRGASFGESRA